MQVISRADNATFTVLQPELSQRLCGSVYQKPQSSRAHRIESSSTIHCLCHCRWNTGSADGSDVPARTRCCSQWILCADDAASLLPEQHAADPSTAKMAESATSAWTCPARRWYVSIVIGIWVTLWLTLLGDRSVQSFGRIFLILCQGPTLVSLCRETLRTLFKLLCICHKEV